MVPTRAWSLALLVVAVVGVCGGTSSSTSTAAKASEWTAKVCAAVDTYTRQTFETGMRVARKHEQSDEDLASEKAYALEQLDALTPANDALIAALRAAKPPPDGQRLDDALTAALQPTFAQTRDAVQSASDDTAVETALANLADGETRWKQGIATETRTLKGTAGWADSAARLLRCLDVPQYESPRALYDELVKTGFACSDYTTEESESDEATGDTTDLGESTATCVHGGTRLDLTTYASDAMRQEDLLSALMFGCGADESLSTLAYVHGPGWLITNFMIESGNPSDFPAQQIAKITGGDLHHVDCTTIRDAEPPTSNNYDDWQQFVDRMLGETNTPTATA